MTSQPRPLSAFLAARGITARPITWPTVPKGADRIRVCLHAANTRSDVDSLVSACIEWAREAVREESLAGGQRLISDGVFSAQAKL
jgi:8-amino-7-oxononanoate synthase